MARPDCGGTPQVFPGLGRDAKGTHEGPAPRNPLHEAKIIRSPGGIGKNCKNKSGTRNEVPSPAKCFNEIFVRIEDLADSIHSDQTGAFPYTSQRGNRYVMVAIHLDANYIFNEPMKNRTEGEMIKAYQKIINRMKAAGLGLKTHRLDNEASAAYSPQLRRAPNSCRV